MYFCLSFSISILETFRKIQEKSSNMSFKVFCHRAIERPSFRSWACEPADVATEWRRGVSMSFVLKKMKRKQNPKHKTSHLWAQRTGSCAGLLLRTLLREGWSSLLHAASRWCFCCDIYTVIKDWVCSAFFGSVVAVLCWGSPPSCCRKLRLVELISN